MYENFWRKSEEDETRDFSIDSKMEPTVDETVLRVTEIQIFFVCS